MTTPPAQEITIPLSDGSAAVLITSSEVAKKLGLRPLARIHTTTVLGSDPLYMLTGVIPATEKVLRRSGLSIDAIDAYVAARKG